MSKRVAMHIQGTTFEFWARSGSRQNILPRCFPKGLPADYAIGPDRIFQNYTRRCGYDVRVFILRAPSRGRDMCHVYLCDRLREAELREKVRERIAHDLRWGVFGHTLVDLSQIHQYVLSRLTRGAQSKYTIQEVSQSIWKDLSPDTRAVIQTWMRKRIFEPATRAPHRAREGSRLDDSDIVTIGLVSALLKSGIGYKDVSGRTTALLE